MLLLVDKPGWAKHRMIGTTSQKSQTVGDELTVLELAVAQLTQNSEVTLHIDLLIVLLEQEMHRHSPALSFAAYNITNK
jgi:hypothetical protein